MRDELTIIIPVFNEEESLPSFFCELDNFVEATPMVARALFINDGSTDGSLKILLEQCRERQTFCTVLTLDDNYGLSTAIKAGIDHCTTSLIGYIDADLQTHPTDFLAYLSFFPEYDMVNGIRQNRQDQLIKKLSSKIANAYRRLMIDDKILDTCCPLKIIKTSFAQQMPFFIGMHRFIPALVQLQGGQVKQLPIAHYPRHAGTSKYHLWNRLVGPFFDTLAFRWIRSRYIRYGVASQNS
jgi:dolichol-phosphate mannosyltransferase